MAARYRHLSPAFLGEAVRSLDGVFGEFCYPGVTAPKGVLNRFGDTTNGEPIPRGKPRVCPADTLRVGRVRQNG